MPPQENTDGVGAPYQCSRADSRLLRGDFDRLPEHAFRRPAVDHFNLDRILARVVASFVQVKAHRGLHNPVVDSWILAWLRAVRILTAAAREPASGVPGESRRHEIEYVSIEQYIIAIDSMCCRYG